MIMYGYLRILVPENVLNSFALFVAIYLFTKLVIFNIKRSSPLKNHKKNISAGNKAIARIKRLEAKGKNAEIFHYIRTSVSPYVFEEMILTSFKRAGGKIKRSARYAGDGGVDGEVRVLSKRHLIQTKKYSEYIKASDVKSHINLCQKKRSKGFFVHSGETGRSSRLNVAGSPVKIISGKTLIDLLVGKLDISKLR